MCVPSEPMSSTSSFASERSGFKPTATCPWPLLSKDYLDNHSPSRRVGISYAMESKRREFTAGVMFDTGHRMKFRNSVVVLSAMAYFHRFYALKDMKRNDRLIVAMAALFIASKSEDHQVALQDIIYQCWACRFGKSDPDEYRKIKDQAFLTNVRDAVLTAERAMLYALGFSLRLQHPHVIIARVWSELKQHADPVVVDFWARTSTNKFNLLQASWDLANDSYRGQACLMYDTKAIGIACIHIALRQARIAADTIPLVDGEPWWTHFLADTGQQDIQAVIALIDQLYEAPLAAISSANLRDWRSLSPSPGFPATVADASPSGTSTATPLQPAAAEAVRSHVADPHSRQADWPHASPAGTSPGSSLQAGQLSQGLSPAAGQTGPANSGGPREGLAALSPQAEGISASPQPLRAIPERELAGSAQAGNHAPGPSPTAAPLTAPGNTSSGRSTLNPHATSFAPAPQAQGAASRPSHAQHHAPAHASRDHAHVRTPVRHPEGAMQQRGRAALPHQPPGMEAHGGSRAGGQAAHAGPHSRAGQNRSVHPGQPPPGKSPGREGAARQYPAPMAHENGAVHMRNSPKPSSILGKRSPAHRASPLSQQPNRHQRTA